MEKKSFQNRAYVRLNLKDQNMNNLVVEVAVMYLIWLTYTREEKSSRVKPHLLFLLLGLYPTQGFLS